MEEFQDFVQQLLAGMQRSNAELVRSIEQNVSERIEISQRHNMEMLQNVLNAQNGNERRVVERVESDEAGKVTIYDGSNDPGEINGFLASLRLRFAIRNIMVDRDKVMLFGSHLKGTAQVWFTNLVGTNFDEMSYGDLEVKFRERFLPVDFKDIAKDKLVKLKQTKSVTEYIKRFGELMQLVEGSYRNEEFLTDTFMAGLKSDIRIPLEVSPSRKSLQHLFQMSQKIDRIVHKRKEDEYSLSPEMLANYSGNVVKDPDSMEIDEAQVKSQMMRRKRTQDKKRHENCYKCGIQGHWARECKNSKENYST